jgi:hypothetical protein
MQRNPAPRLWRPGSWDDIWVIRFAPDGRAAEFTEWPIKRG